EAWSGPPPDDVILGHVSGGGPNGNVVYDTQYQMMPLIRSWGTRMRSRLLVVLVVLVGVLAAACGTPSGATGGRTLQVIAGEDFWGSIAAQLGGSRVSVTSVVTNPNADPHDYESSTSDARALTTADYVILNGAGYDDWGSKLLAGNPSRSRKLFTVADLLHKKAADNPHFWYNPTSVDQVVDRITADYQAIDPADASYFSQQRAAFRQALQPYHDRMASIKKSFGGTPVDSTEGIFASLAQALDLTLTPPA